MRAPFFVSVLALAAFAAAQAPASTPPPASRPPAAQDPAAAPKKLDEKTWEHFGAGIAEGGTATPLADALKKPEDFTGKTVRIEAPITAVCKVKGCWMNVGSEQPPVRVTFKDYGFFVPKDASGRTTIVEGTLTMKQLTVEQTKHYLEDAGKPEEAAKVTEGRKEWSFVATGVAIKKIAKKLDDNAWDQFGAGIADGSAATLADVLKKPEDFTGKTVRIEGPISGVCQTKGCWMNLGSQTPPMHVTFKDYGFFMPKDASGRTAIVEGTMKFEQQTIERTKHLLEDAGKPEEAAKVTEGRKIWSFVATGVAIKKAEQPAK